MEYEEDMDIKFDYDPLSTSNADSETAERNAYGPSVNCNQDQDFSEVEDTEELQTAASSQEEDAKLITDIDGSNGNFLPIIIDSVESLAETQNTMNMNRGAFRFRLKRVASNPIRPMQMPWAASANPDRSPTGQSQNGRFKSRHTKPFRKHTCLVCNKVFYSPSTLATHVTSNHGKGDSVKKPTTSTKRSQTDHRGCADHDCGNQKTDVDEFDQLCELCDQEFKIKSGSNKLKPKVVQCPHCNCLNSASYASGNIPSTSSQEVFVSSASSKTKSTNYVYGFMEEKGKRHSIKLHLEIDSISVPTYEDPPILSPMLPLSPSPTSDKETNCDKHALFRFKDEREPSSNYEPKHFAAKTRPYNRKPANELYESVIDINKLCCEDCGKTFLSNSRYESHILTHFERTKYYCRFCKFSSQTREEQEKHELGLRHNYVMSQTPSPACSQTDETVQVTLTTSTETHQPPDDIPERIFNSDLEKVLTPVVTRVAKITSYVCVHCPREFRSHKELCQHDRIHLLKKKLQLLCDICGGIFGNEGGLVAHKNAMHFEPKQIRLGY